MKGAVGEGKVGVWAPHYSQTEAHGSSRGKPSHYFSNFRATITTFIQKQEINDGAHREHHTRDSTTQVPHSTSVLRSIRTTTLHILPHKVSQYFYFIFQNSYSKTFCESFYYVSSQRTHHLLAFLNTPIEVPSTT